MTASAHLWAIGYDDLERADQVRGEIQPVDLARREQTVGGRTVGGRRHREKRAERIFVVHDQNPRALSPKVKGFLQPQSWFVDLTAVTVR